MSALPGYFRHQLVRYCEGIIIGSTVQGRDVNEAPTSNAAEFEIIRFACAIPIC
jgi:hypothetical protein